ncbi:MAG TPA: tetratricopeptide repeat protein [Candidatus Obscuribacterales bacterium]
MGLLGLFGSNISNPALVAAIGKYCGDANDENLAELWNLFLKSKLLLATTADGAKNFGKVKQMREAVGISFHCATNERGDNLLMVFADSETFKAHVPESAAHVTMTGEQAFQLASAKGLLGMIINPKGEHSAELKVWQHQVFIEKVGDPIKLHALASKLIRGGNQSDAEGVLKAAIFASQREHGAQHPFTAELNIELARVLRSENKIEQAEWTYRRALGIYESAGSMDMELATTAEGLGMMLMEADKAPQAVPLLEKALAVYERIPGGRPESIARILCFLGDVRCQQGKTEEGEHLYKRASVTLEERKHPDVFGVLLKMGDLAEKAGRHKEAFAYYNRVISAFDSWKRGKEIEVAKAAHRAGMLQLEDNKPSEAMALLERALQSYRREQAVAQVEEVEAQLIKLREENSLKVKEEAQSTTDPNKPAYGRSTGKRPADLPLLDMNAVKSNPRATFVGPKAEQKPKEEKPLDAEEAALAQMRAFLDSVGKEGALSASGSRPAAPVSDAPAPSAMSETPPPVPAEALRHVPAGDAPPAVPTPAPERVAELPASESKEMKSVSPVADADRFDKPIAERKADADRFDKPIQERGGTAAAAEESGGVTSDVDSSVDGAFDSLLTEVKGEKGSDRYDKPIGERQSDADRFDKPIGERKSDADRFDKPISERAETPQSPPPLPETAAAAEVKLDDEWSESLKSDEKSGLSGLAADEDEHHVEINELFSGVGSKASGASAPKVKTPVPGNPRTSGTSIPARQVPPPVPPLSSNAPAAEVDSAPSAVSKTQASDEDARKSFDELQPAHSLGQNMAGDISGIFNKSVLGDLSKDDRFDKPISERSADQDVMLNKSIVEQADSDLSRFDKPIAERTAEANKLDASRFDTPIQERNGTAAAADESDGMFSDLDDSLDSAFNSLLAEPKASDAGRFDKPIQERAPAPEGDVTIELVEKPSRESMEPTVELPRSTKIDAVPEAAAATPSDQSEPAPAAKAEPAPSEPKPAAEPEEAPDAKPAPTKPKVDLTTAKTPEELISLLEQRLEDEPTNAELWLRKGTALAQLQRLDEAIKAFDKVTTLVPSDVKGWYCKGSTLHLKGRFEDAAYCFNYLLKLDADNVKAMMRKAECLVKLGRADQSMALYDRILELQPKFVAGWLSKARTLVQERKLEAALTCYDHVLTLEPGNEEAVKAKNLIATKLGAAAGT